MKISFLFLFAFMQISASNFAQNISLSVKDENLKTVLKEIKKQSGYQFFYNESMLRNANLVTINVKDESLKNVLELCFLYQPFSYAIINKTIVVKPKEDLLPESSQQQVKEISGKVTDSNGEPLIGATVSIKGSAEGTVTDRDGNYKIKAEKNAILVVSFIGYLTEEKGIEALLEVNVQLLPDIKSIDEVQVIGYGTTSKRLNSGSVSSITSEEISKQTVTNPLTALQGHIPGMEITQDNGLPGAGVRIKVRGAGSSYYSGFIPLYVIDGVPFTLFNGSTPTTDNLNAYGLSGAS